MGLYIDWPDRLAIGKAARLKNKHGAVDFEGSSFADVPEDKVLVFVAENREGDATLSVVGSDGRVETFGQSTNFDAAGIVRDERDFEEMSDPSDPRTIHRLLLDRDEAEKLVPQLAQVLPR